MVRSVKKYQVITKVKEFFLKNSSEMLKNMKHMEEVYSVSLVSEDNERIRAHKMVLASVNTPSSKCSILMTGIHVMN